MTDQEIAVKLIALGNSTALPPFHANAMAMCLLNEIKAQRDKLPKQTVELLLGVAVVLERYHMDTAGKTQTTGEILGFDQVH